MVKLLEMEKRFHSGELTAACNSGVFKWMCKSKFDIFQDIILVNSLFLKDLVALKITQSGEMSFSFKSDDHFK
jgi:hypothetical protein